MVGGGPSGSTTSTGTSMPWDSGNRSEVENQALALMRDAPFSYYPNATYASPDPSLITGLQNAGNVGYASGQVAGELTPGMQGAALNANTALASGAGIAAATPWLNMLSGFGYNNPAQQSINALMGVGTGEAAQDLSKTASGYYLDNQNPYLAKQFDAAADPVTRAFMSATAPKTDSAMEANGRFNSGATSSAQAVNQSALGDTLENLGTNLYGNAYNQERGRMDAAAAQLGSLQNTAFGNAGQLGVTGQNSQTAAVQTALDQWSRLLSGQQAAINQTPTLSNMYAQDYNVGANSRSQLQQLDQAQINDQIARFYGNQSAPWQGVEKAASVLGSPIPGFTSQTTPYFSPSPLAQIGSLASSGVGIASALGGK